MNLNARVLYQNFNLLINKIVGSVSSHSFERVLMHQNNAIVNIMLNILLMFSKKNKEFTLLKNFRYYYVLVAIQNNNTRESVTSEIIPLVPSTFLA